MAHKMGAGSTKNTRDSQSQRLGVKCFRAQKWKQGILLSTWDKI
jgi:ribosomal protein L27